MPNVIFHRNGETFVGEVKENTNLVVRAGIRQFPYPNFLYGCGMGKCGKCASLIIRGGEHLPEPNWKETKRLGARIEQGYRLACQLWLTHDVELSQEAAPLVDVVAPAGAAVGRT
ncbi:2Fe-2S iron-sulfur cluster-binding protein [Bradyrhizobium sp. JR3.5]